MVVATRSTRRRALGVVLCAVSIAGMGPQAIAAPAGRTPVMAAQGLAPTGEMSPDALPERLGGLRTMPMGSHDLEPGVVLEPRTSETGSEDADGTEATEDGATTLLMPIDVDGDGIDELLERTAVGIDWTLSVTRPSTGAPLWSYPIGAMRMFFVDVVPSATGPGSDVLYIMWGRGAWTIRLIDGATGVDVWSDTVDSISPLDPNHAPLNYYGLAPNGNSFDVVTASWGGVYSGLVGYRTITVEVRSLATGEVEQRTVLRGANVQPSVALAGDLDGDGVGDLYTFEAMRGGTTPRTPYAPSQTTRVSAGLLRAVTDRGEEIAGAAIYPYGHDGGAYLWPESWDVSGDGVRDPVIFSDYLGDPYECIAPYSSVDIVDGSSLAGVVELLHGALLMRQTVWAIEAPGDLDGDGNLDLVASGWQFWCDTGRVTFEAFGDNGYLWSREYVRHYREWMGDWAWWTNVGDLNGDGVHDAVMRQPYSERLHTYRVEAIDQRTGEPLWSVDDPPAGYLLPMGVDVDGDGRTDVLTGYRQQHANGVTTTEFGLARGDLAPLWPSRHVRTLRDGPYGVWIAAGRFLDGSVELVVDYSANDRHTRDIVDGSTGRRL